MPTILKIIEIIHSYARSNKIKSLIYMQDLNLFLILKENINKKDLGLFT